MGIHYSTNLRTLIAKVESVAGVAETLTDSDFDVRCESIEVTPETPVSDEAAKTANGNHSERESLAGAQSVQVSFSVPLAASGSVSAAPKLEKLLGACGLASVAYGTTGIGFVRRKAEDENTLTLWVQEAQIGTGGVLTHVVKGAVGSVSLSADGIGGAVMLNFTFTGAYVGEDATKAALTLTGADTTVGEKLLNTDVTIGSTDMRISNVTFDLQNDIQPVIDQSEATGYSHYYIARTQPRLSVNPLKISPTTKDILSEYKNETTQTVQIAFQSYTLNIPVGQIIGPATASREGLSSWDLNIKALGNGTVDADLTAEDTFELLYGSRT